MLNLRCSKVCRLTALASFLRVKVRVWQPFQRGELRFSLHSLPCGRWISHGWVWEWGWVLREQNFYRQELDSYPLRILDVGWLMKPTIRVVVRSTLVKRTKVVRLAFLLFPFMAQLLSFFLTRFYARVKDPTTSECHNLNSSLKDFYVLKGLFRKANNPVSRGAHFWLMPL